MQCSYDSDHIWVCTDIINGQALPNRVREILADIDSNSSLDAPLYNRTPAPRMSYDDLLEYLSLLLHNDSSEVPWDSPLKLLAVSKVDTTVYFRVLIDADCFDEQGRFLKISHGRLQYKRCHRELVYEEILGIAPKTLDQIGWSTELANGFSLSPHYADNPEEQGGDGHITMDVTMNTDKILVSFKVRSMVLKDDVAISAFHSFRELFQCAVPASCRHDRERPWVVSEFVDSTRICSRLSNLFLPKYSRRNMKKEDEQVMTTLRNDPQIARVLRIYALKGSRTEQFFQVALLGLYFQGLQKKRPRNIYLQINSCLECTIREGLQCEDQLHVVMC
jgi:hypothetical protein